MRNCIL